MAPRFFLQWGWRRPRTNAAEPLPPRNDESARLPDDKVITRGLYGDGSSYSKAVSLDVGWREGRDGPWLDDRREDERWGDFVLEKVMDVPSGWNEERRRRDERDRKRRQGLVKSIGFQGGEFWEDEDDEYHWLVFRKKKSSEREVWMGPGLSDAGRKQLLNMPNVGFQSRIAIPRPHTPMAYRNAGLYLPSFFAGENNTIPLDQRWHSCQFCNEFPLNRLLHSPSEKYKFSRDTTTLESEERFCPLDIVIYSCIQHQNVPNGKDVELSIEIPSPARASKDSVSEAPQTVSFPSLCADLGVSETHMEIQKLLRIFPEAGSKGNFRLLNDWLRVCHSTHNHKPYSIGFLPERVIDVGWDEDSTEVKLFDTGGRTTGVYIALSHRWGQDYKKYNTTRRNFAARLNDIPFDDLPVTFQHAIIAARQLRVQFLWIDSLCIIQDSEDDWARESKRMQGIFAEAYFTIAATSATVDKGFLYRSADHFVRLGHDTCCAYISKAGADFNRDVEQGELNQRGWVLQERALSRRVIHFTAAQTYFECGSAIFCESNDTIDYRNTLSSSDFPGLDSSGGAEDQRSTFTDVFQRYSRLGLTMPTDRPVAINGLEHRLQDFYRTESVYGIVRSFFGQSLLWQGCNGQVEPIIDFTRDINSWLIGKEKVPSWSWMAYKGPLGYLESPVEDLTWETGFKFVYSEDDSRCILRAPLTQAMRTCRLQSDLDESNTQHHNTKYVLAHENGDIVGRIQYDYRDGGEKPPETERLGFIVLARSAGICNGDKKGKSPANKGPGADIRYVLLVERVIEKSYRRRGLAMIDGRFLYREGAVSVF